MNSRKIADYLLYFIVAIATIIVLCGFVALFEAYGIF